MPISIKPLIQKRKLTVTKSMIFQSTYPYILLCLIRLGLGQLVCNYVGQLTLQENCYQLDYPIPIRALSDNQATMPPKPNHLFLYWVSYPLAYYNPSSFMLWYKFLIASNGVFPIPSNGQSPYGIEVANH